MGRTRPLGVVLLAVGLAAGAASRAQAAGGYAAMDANKDGFVSREEVLAAGDDAARKERATARRERWIERLDTDHDGRVSREEYRAWRTGLFDRLDKDKDGRLSPDELPHRPARG